MAKGQRPRLRAKMTNLDRFGQAVDAEVDSLWRMRKRILLPLVASMPHDSGVTVGITPNGGFHGSRTDAHATRTKASLHRRGAALDITVSGWSSEEIALRLASLRMEGKIPLATRVIVYPGEPYAHADLIKRKRYPRDLMQDVRGVYVPLADHPTLGDLVNEDGRLRGQPYGQQEEHIPEPPAPPRLPDGVVRVGVPPG
jgi:hypothetical protein